jgi:hypothetical protein
MPSLEQLRALKAKTPAAKGMTDAEFALAMHEQAYNDVPLDVFLSKNGLDPNAVRREIKPGSPYAKYLGVVDQKIAKARTSTSGREEVSMPEGIIRSVGQGLSLGFGDELIGGANALFGDIGSPDYWAKMNQRYQEAQASEARKIKSFETEHPWIAGASEIGGSLLPGLIAAPFTGGASLAPSMGKAALMAAASGAAYGYGKSEDPNDPNSLVSLKRLEAAVPTAVLSGLGGALGSKISSLVKPVEEDAVVRAAADTLENAGVTALTAGQKTGNVAVQDLELRGGRKITDMLTEQKQQFANAVWKDIGLNQIDDAIGKTLPKELNDISKSSVRAADGVFSKAYQTLESYPMLFDSQLMSSLDAIVKNFGGYSASGSMGLTHISPTVLGTINRIKNAVTSGGVISAGGKLYNQMYKELGREIAAAPDFVTREALRQLQNALDEAMKRGIAATGSKTAAADAALVDTLRPAYQKFLAVVNASADRVDGKFIDPGKLLNSVEKMDPNAVTRGTGNLATLATLADAADTVGLTLAKAPAKSLPYRYTVPGILGGGAALLTPADPITRGIVGAAVAGGTELGGKALRAMEGRVAASRLGQNVLSNNGPDAMNYLGGLGDAITSAAPTVSGGLDRMFGLGPLAQNTLP